mmetsp:Transcript_8378/g.17524  ORF Transcript_8378/g.17524 Transcript_8378/m.17524 type:complete len:112 (+) Transcript_8378:499-834(+)
MPVPALKHLVGMLDRFLLNLLNQGCFSMTRTAVLEVFLAQRNRMPVEGKKKRAITSNLIFEQSNCKRRPAEYNSSCGQSNDIPPISVDQSTQNARFRGHLDLFSPIAKMGT